MVERAGARPERLDHVQELVGAGVTLVVAQEIAVALLVGVVLMVIWYLFPRSKPFFQGRSLNRETPVMVPDEPGDIIRSIDGGI